MSAGSLVFVLGKGGVGRSSMTAALAWREAKRGRRALVVEINGLADIGRRFGQPRSFEPRTLAPGLDWRSLDMRDCLSDFGRRKLKLGRIGARLVSSRPLRAFVAAVPGLSDIIQLGKIENLLTEPLPGDATYDVVFVDCPATGHGLSLLAAPGTLTELSESGPFHELARVIATALTDGTSRAVVVTLAEQLPVQETVSLVDELERRAVPIDRIVANKLVTAPLPDRSGWPAVRDAQPDTPDHRALVELVERIDAIARDQEAWLGRLHQQAEARQLSVEPIPFVDAPKARGVLEAIAEHHP